ncbi:MAG: pyridoxal phosphate-dependent aminotransferase, partial [Coriobacteriales bacterium]|nr:pyridoxal phosphate-dependent aminotransferase [Coriobacteriales bacterium]
MINQRMYDLGAAPSAIRELFAYGMERKAMIGADKVFDFSIGNPSVPAPEAIKDAVLRLMEEPFTELVQPLLQIGNLELRKLRGTKRHHIERQLGEVTRLDIL